MFEKLYIYIDIYINKMRIFILKLRGAKVGKNVKSFGKFKVINPKKLSIGDNSTINENVFLNCRDFIIIGSNCHLSPNVQLHTGKLLLDIVPRKHIASQIVIKDNVWIASGSIISAGVIISENIVIGANSVVTKSLESNSLYAGNPAKKIKELNV